MNKAQRDTAAFREAQMKQQDYMRERDKARDDEEHIRFRIRQDQLARTAGLNAAATLGIKDEAELLAAAGRFAKWVSGS